MAIENVTASTKQVRNFAVCCTAKLSIEAINHFLTEVHRQEHKESFVPVLTVVDSLDRRLSGPTKELRGDDKHLQSPFSGCDFLQINQMLQEMIEATGSALDPEWFLVLDGESVQSSSAVIVNIGNLGVRTVRVTYPVPSRYLAASSIAHPSIEELSEIAEKTDGILDD